MFTVRAQKPHSPLFNRCISSLHNHTNGLGSEGIEEKQYHVCTENQERPEDVTELWQVETVLRGDTELQRARETVI